MGCLAKGGEKRFQKGEEEYEDRTRWEIQWTEVNGSFADSTRLRGDSDLEKSEKSPRKNKA